MNHADLGVLGEPGGIRTHDPMIKSHVLYRLSYGLRAPLLTEKRGALPALRAPLEHRASAAWFPPC
jgi:hypothetical protein